MLDLEKKLIKDAAEIIKNAKHLTAFTGAGISVESGIPSYRGESGLWTKHDTSVLEIQNFWNNPAESWKVIKQVFLQYLNKAQPNKAHLALAELEKKDILKAIITQNIDNLHTKAGNTTVYEFHGNSKNLICFECDSSYNTSEINLNVDVPVCKKCKKPLKPDFIFFGEGIPSLPYQMSIKEADTADVFLIIGTTGKVFPAASIPVMAKRNGAIIIEINPERSDFTGTITDIYIKGKSGEIMTKILEEIEKEL